MSLRARAIVLGMGLALCMMPLQANSNASTELRRLILQQADRNTPPAPPNHVVQIETYLENLLEVDTRRQTFTITFWRRAYWRDLRLSWSTTDWPKVDVLNFDSATAKEIWQPDEIIYEVLRSTSESNSGVMVFPDGSCQRHVQFVTTIPCNMDVSLFPFDTQHCTFTVGSSQYTQNQMDLQPRQLSAETQIKWKTANGVRVYSNMSALEYAVHFQTTEFAITGMLVRAQLVTYYCCPQPFSILKYEINLRRTVWSYAIETILPLIIVTVVTHLGMLMQSAGGGRTSLGVTAMLTTTSMYYVAASEIPNTGRSTLLGRLYLVCLFNGLAVIFGGVVTTSLTLVREDDLLTESYLLDVFRRFDTDQCDRLGIEEAIKALREVGLDEIQQKKCLLMLDIDGDGMISRSEWLRLRSFATFDRKGRVALARHHNYFTGWLLRRALEREKDAMSSMESTEQSLKRELSLMTTDSCADAAWKLLVKFQVAGNKLQLSQTQSLLSVSASASMQAQQIFTEDVSRLTEKIRTTARAVIDAHPGLTHEMGWQSSEDLLIQMEQCIQGALWGQRAVPFIPESRMIIPVYPKLEQLYQWSSQDLQSFLLHAHGDMCEKARFAENAHRLSEHGVDGACADTFNHATAAECGITVGDRPHVVKGLKIVSNLFRQACKQQYEFKVSVQRAEHLPAMGAFDTSCFINARDAPDAYVVLRLDDKVSRTSQKYTSMVIGNTYNPVWHGTFKIFHLRDLQDPGILSVSLFGSNLLSTDQLMGSCSLVDVVDSLSYKSQRPSPDQQSFSSLNLSDILQECLLHSASPISREFTIHKDGAPSIGHDGLQTKVVLGFELLSGQRQFSQLVKGSNYPRHCSAHHHQIRIVAVEDQDHSLDGAVGNVVSSHYHLKGLKPLMAVSEAHESLKARSHARSRVIVNGDNFGLPVSASSDNDTGSRTEGSIIVNDDFAHGSSQRVAHLLSAEIDQIMIVVLPILFFGYLICDLVIYCRAFDPDRWTAHTRIELLNERDAVGAECLHFDFWPQMHVHHKCVGDRSSIYSRPFISIFVLASFFGALLLFALWCPRHCFSILPRKRRILLHRPATIQSAVGRIHTTYE